MSKKEIISFDDFEKVDIRVGVVTKAEVNKKARVPAYKLWVDFGEEIGVKQSSAQITEVYSAEELVGMQVMGVVNFDSRLIGGFKSEVLILGTYSEQGVVLVTPTQKVKPGDILG